MNILNFVRNENMHKKADFWNIFALNRWISSSKRFQIFPDLQTRYDNKKIIQLISIVMLYSIFIIKNQFHAYLFLFYSYS